MRAALVCCRHLISTKITVHPCYGCGLYVYEGLAEGLRIVASPISLNPDGEIAALLDGRHTFSLRGSTLIERDCDRLSDLKLRQFPVVAEHVCGFPLPPLSHRVPNPRQADLPPLNEEGFPY